VERVVGAESLRELEAFVEEQHFSFWGKEKPNDFKTINLYVCI